MLDLSESQEETFDLIDLSMISADKVCTPNFKIRYKFGLEKSI